MSFLFSALPAEGKISERVSQKLSLEGVEDEHFFSAQVFGTLALSPLSGKHGVQVIGTKGGIELGCQKPAQKKNVHLPPPLGKVFETPAPRFYPPPAGQKTESSLGGEKKVPD
jgi:hypothetical protein